jgi:hypothetical protein
MSEAGAARLYFDRRAPEALIAALSGELHALVTLALSPEHTASALDLQLRADPRAIEDGHATLYVGLTKALDLAYASDGRFRVLPQTKFGPGMDWNLAPAWADPLPLDEMARLWPEVIDYAVATIAATPPRYTQKEGGMQAVLSNADADDFAVIDREVVVGFSPRSKDAFLAPTKNALSNLVPDLVSQGEVWARERSFGDELDALAIDSEGRVLVMEVKPGTETTDLGWTPAQVLLYHRLLSSWAEQDAESAPQALDGMLRQRVRIGLEREREWSLRRPLELVPVIAVGGRVKNPRVANERMRAVTDALRRAGLASKEPEVWQVDDAGHVEVRGVGSLQ